MRYIVVNERKPKGLPRFCCFCLKPIEDQYTRDLDLRTIYCSPLHYEVHVHDSLVTFGAYEAPRLLEYEKGGLR